MNNNYNPPSQSCLLSSQFGGWESRERAEIMHGRPWPILISEVGKLCFIGWISQLAKYANNSRLVFCSHTVQPGEPLSRAGPARDTALADTRPQYFSPFVICLSHSHWSCPDIPPSQWMIFLPPQPQTGCAVITAGDMLVARRHCWLPEKSHVTPVNHISPSIAPRQHGSSVVRRALNSKYQNN